MKNDHYFTENPRSPRNERTIRLLYRGRILKLTTSGGVFASEGLDPGTGLLVANLVLRGDERVLDLGCGWGPIGIAAALSLPTGSVLMTDVNKRAVDLARRNARDAGATNVEVRTGTLYLPAGEERFDVILSNPPYKAGRETVLNILTEAPRHLREGGKLLLVGKGGQGILYYQHFLEEHWSHVEVLARGGGYRVLEARGPPQNVEAVASILGTQSLSRP